MRVKSLMVVALSLLLSQEASGEMRVTTRDGRVLTLNVDASQVRSIEFSDSSGAVGPGSAGRPGQQGQAYRNPPASQPGWGAQAQPGQDAAASVYSGKFSWQSNGTLTLKVDGNTATGRYTLDNGEIVGTLRGNVFEGYWIEDSSPENCGAAKNGRSFWGRLRFEFTSPDSFQAAWSYCDKPLGPLGSGGYRVDK